MNWLEESQQEQNEEINQQNYKYIQHLFPRRELQSSQKVALIANEASVNFWRIVNCLKCPLCEIFINQPIYLSCSHRFCKQCFIKQNLSCQNKFCPICKTYLESKNMIYRDQWMNQFYQYIYKWFLELDKKQDTKRLENNLHYKEEKVKIFKSNKGEALTVKKQIQQVKVKIQEFDRQHVKIDAQTQCSQIKIKQELVQKSLEIIEARSIIALKPRNMKNQPQNNQFIRHIKGVSKFIKIKIQKLPSNILTPKLDIHQVMINENCNVRTIATLIAQQLNISRKQIYIFNKARNNYFQLHSKDTIKNKIQDIIYLQVEQKKRDQSIKLSINRFIQNQYTYQKNLKNLKAFGTLYFSVRL